MNKIIDLGAADLDDISEDTIIEMDPGVSDTDTDGPIDITVEEQEQNTIIDFGGADYTGPQNLADLTDVDTSEVENDSLLIYNAVAETWIPSRYLGNHELEAGHY